jgi:hypothetical protein
MNSRSEYLHVISLRSVSKHTTDPADCHQESKFEFKCYYRETIQVKQSKNLPKHFKSQPNFLLFRIKQRRKLADHDNKIKKDKRKPYCL